MKITIIYWTNTGNTEKMAELIKEGIEGSNPEAKIAIKAVGKSVGDDIKESDIVVLGSPAMGVEELDTSEMEPFIKSNKDTFNGKSIALFGSYGWGDGEWMRSWEDMMSEIGAKIEVESLIVNESPDGQSKDECIAFGKNISQIRS